MPKQPDLDWCCRIGQLMGRCGVSSRERLCQRPGYDRHQVRALEQCRQGEEMRQRHGYAWRLIALRECALKCCAVIHFGSACKSTFGDEAVNCSVLAASERNNNQRELRQRCLVKLVELTLLAGDEDVVVF